MILVRQKVWVKTVWVGECEDLVSDNGHRTQRLMTDRGAVEPEEGLEKEEALPGSLCPLREM